jgi:hypothetical protein
LRQRLTEKRRQEQQQSGPAGQHSGDPVQRRQPYLAALQERAGAGPVPVGLRRICGGGSHLLIPREKPAVGSQQVLHQAYLHLIPRLAAPGGDVRDDGLGNAERLGQ